MMKWLAALKSEVTDQTGRDVGICLQPSSQSGINSLTRPETDRDHVWPKACLAAMAGNSPQCFCLSLSVSQLCLLWPSKPTRSKILTGVFKYLSILVFQCHHSMLRPCISIILFNTITYKLLCYWLCQWFQCSNKDSVWAARCFYILLFLQ